MDAQIAQNPSTLTQVLGVNESAADLHTGTLRSGSNAQAYRFGADNLHANAGGFAQLYDTITFSGGFTGQVELRMIISGSMLASTAGSPISGQSVASLFGFTDAGVEQGSASIWIDQFTSGGAFISNQSSFGLPADINTNADALGNFDPGNIQATLSLFFDVTAAEPSFTFGSRLATSAGLGPFIAIADQVQTNDVDFGNTAHLSLIVPAGVAWTSSSGAFLVPASSAVPEPSAAALIAAGCFGLGWLGWRRSRKAGLAKIPR
jgi:hypothetical protein